MTKEKLPIHLSHLDTACEKTAHFLDLATSRIAELVRKAIEDLLETHPNNITYSVDKNEEGEIILMAEKGAEQIRLTFKLLLSRGGALGSLSGERLLKVTRQFNGESEVVAKEIV